MQFHKFKLLDDVIIQKYVWFLEFYYILGYLINMSAHYYTIKNYPEVWNLPSVNIGNWTKLITPILILIMTSIFILFFIPKCQKLNLKIYIYVVPLIIFITSIISLLSIPSGMNFGYIGLLAALSFFILIFLLILFYDETPTNEKALELMHKRYLQFLQSFVFLIIGGGTWLIFFLLQQMPPTKTPMFPIAFSVAAFQNVFVGGVGLLLVVYSLNERLRYIERELDES